MAANSGLLLNGVGEGGVNAKAATRMLKIDAHAHIHKYTHFKCRVLHVTQQ